MESSSDNTVVSVGVDNFAPNASKSGVLLGVLCLVHVSDSLAHIKACLFLFFDTFDLNSSLTLMSVSLACLESQESASHVKSAEH